MNEPAALVDDRLHKESFTVDGVLTAGRYCGTPVLVVRDEGDGYVIALWPDRKDPGRSHRKPKPFTFAKGEWWRIPRDQIDTDVDFLSPTFPLTLEPKPVSDAA
jgi:hypothetical protein